MTRSARYRRANRIRWILASLMCLAAFICARGMRQSFFTTYAVALLFSPDEPHGATWCALFPWLRDLHTR
jgi:hypothetical protein